MPIQIITSANDKNHILAMAFDKPEAKKAPVKKQKSATKRFKTYIPLFPGFSNTMFDYIKNCRYENDGYNTYEEFDKLPHKEQVKLYRAYEKIIGNIYSEKIQEELIQIGIKAKIQFLRVSSPKEYNFENDDLEVYITLNTGRLHKFLTKNKDVITPYFEEKYQSRDGFIPFFSSDVDTWLTLYYAQMQSNRQMKGVGHFEFKNRELIIGKLLEACLKNVAEVDEEDLTDTVYYKADEQY